MELEGFNASLVGRAIYVFAKGAKAWIPWEFLSAKPHSCRIYITESEAPQYIEGEYVWNAVFRPSGLKDWSCIATMIRGMGPTALLVFDGAVSAPQPFYTFLDTCMATRIWIGEHIEIPTIPDAIFFPAASAEVFGDVTRTTNIHSMLERLPGRNGHGQWQRTSPADLQNILKMTGESELGLVMSDIGERTWNLCWHKVCDSRSETVGTLVKRGLSWMHVGMAIVENYS